MRMKSVLIATTLLTMGMGVAQAQGIIGGVQRGSEEGARAAGPVGGLVGGVVGGVAGGVAGLIGVDQRPRFHEYVVEQRPAAYRWDGPVEVGTALPEAGVVYYDVPPEYGVRGYRYTVVNGRTVLVEPRTRRIVQVID